VRTALRLAALAATAALAWSAAGQTIIRPAIPVQSEDTRYIKAVHAALELLRTQAPADYVFARRHVGRVLEVQRFDDVGMAVMHEPPVAKLRRREVLGSQTWLASVLVHEACHRFQYVRGVEKHGTKYPPDDEYYGQKAELECLKRQQRVLERLQAPAHEIAWVRDADGTHYLYDEFGRRRR